MSCALAAVRRAAPRQSRLGMKTGPVLGWPNAPTAVELRPRIPHAHEYQFSIHPQEVCWSAGTKPQLTGALHALNKALGSGPLRQIHTWRNLARKGRLVTFPGRTELGQGRNKWRCPHKALVPNNKGRAVARTVPARRRQVDPSAPLF